MATIAAKLAASEREADAARVRAKLKAARAARMGRNADKTVLPPPNTSSNVSESHVEMGSEPVKRDREHSQNSRNHGDHHQQQPDISTEKGAVEGGEGKDDLDAVDFVVEKPRKRERRTSKAANRRRSTLNPRELQSLMLGDVGAE